jgi:hypothetical protein
VATADINAQLDGMTEALGAKSLPDDVAKTVESEMLRAIGALRAAIMLAEEECMASTAEPADPSIHYPLSPDDPTLSDWKRQLAMLGRATKLATEWSITPPDAKVDAVCKAGPDAFLKGNFASDIPITDAAGGMSMQLMLGVLAVRESHSDVVSKALHCLPSENSLGVEFGHLPTVREEILKKAKSKDQPAIQASQYIRTLFETYKQARLEAIGELGPVILNDVSLYNDLFDLLVKSSSHDLFDRLSQVAAMPSQVNGWSCWAGKPEHLHQVEDLKQQVKDAHARDKKEKKALLLALEKKGAAYEGSMSIAEGAAMFEKMVSCKGDPPPTSVKYLLLARRRSADDSIDLYDLVSRKVAQLNCEATVVPGSVKPLPRSVFKTVLAYSLMGCFAQVNDVTRLAIKVKTLLDLTTVVEAIAADDEILVLRHRNRLDPLADSAPDGGYRDYQMIVLVKRPKPKLTVSGSTDRFTKSTSASSLAAAKASSKFGNPEYYRAEISVQLEAFVYVSTGSKGGGQASFQTARAIEAYSPSTYSYMGGTSAQLNQRVSTGMLLGIQFALTADEFGSAASQEFWQAVNTPGSRVRQIGFGGTFGAWDGTVGKTMTINNLGQLAQPNASKMFADILAWKDDIFSSKDGLGVTETLQISNCDLGPECAGFIRAVLPKFTNLTKLDFSGNQLTEAVPSQRIADAFQSLASTLVELNLEGNNIEAAGANCVATGIASMSKLTVLNLASNPIGVEGAMSLAGVLSNLEDLQGLNLSSCQIGAGGFTALALALPFASRLAVLNLKDNSIGEDGEDAGAALVEMLPNLSAVVEFNAAANGFDAEVMQAIADSTAATSQTIAETEHAAAAKIQAGFRGLKVRRQIADENAAAVKVQSAFRGHQIRKMAAQENAAAITVQSAFRGHLVRKVVAEENAAAVKVQAAFRGHSVRKAAAEEKAATICIQKTSTGPCTNNALAGGERCSNHTCEYPDCSTAKSSSVQFCKVHAAAPAVEEGGGGDGGGGDDEEEEEEEDDDDDDADWSEPDSDDGGGGGATEGANRESVRSEEEINGFD